MLVQSKFQIEKKDYEFIKKAYRQLSYKSLSEYIREAINNKIKEDRKKIRDLKRLKAMEMINQENHDNAFETIEGENFEER
ncbi:MAG: crotonobetainyl-CoA--carnitine CoA-transferase [Deltaproteobacteria bacterium RBG_13_43_22]|nr:MAG: crotonobetainyl-CoA--carnitine CoA-transferase [Deltaproteobacteria bacterium RBG_13_43_22]